MDYFMVNGFESIGDWQRQRYKLQGKQPAAY